MQHFFVFDRDYLDELVGIAWPVIEHGACQFGTGVQVVLADELVQFLAVGGLFDEAQFYHFHVAEIVEVAVPVPYVGHTAGHACGKVASRLSEYYHAPAGHILAAVVAYTLHYGCGTGVADGKALACTAVDVNFTACGAVKQGVACNRVFLCLEVAPYRRQDGDASATQTFAQIIVGLAFQLEVDTRDKECPETLPGGAFELHVQRMFGQPFFSVFCGNDTREHGTAGTVGIGDGVLQRDFLLVLYGFGGGM